MPYAVRKSSAKGGGYNVTKNGRKVGHAPTKAKAQTSARIANSAHRKKTGRRH
jgi:hypothetical protein